MNRRAWAGLLALALLVLTGCTGIPTSSAPQVVRTVSRAPAATAAQTHLAPLPGDGPSQVVNGFINAGVDPNAEHSAARQFLTDNAARRWQDNQTVILSELNVGDPAISGSADSLGEQTATVRVTGRRIGQLDSGGIFSPTLKGMGTGDEEPFDFRLIKPAGGQWRIDQLQSGVLIKSTDFGDDYHQRALYFDVPQLRIVVPDLRYTPLTGPAMASWLVAQLIAGPRPELSQSVTNEVPDQTKLPSVQLGNPTVVEMPGSSQLDIQDRNGLAAQLAYTLEQVPGQLELTDSGKPVQIPAASGTEFSVLNFTSATPQSGGQLYFLRGGAVIDGSKDAPLSDILGQPTRNFSSVAMRQGSGQSPQAAGLTGASQLQIGSAQGLTATRLPQPATSRPEWRPNSDDVWIGAGSRIYRAVAGGAAQPVSLTSQVGALPTGPITAVRFSSDGARVALAISGPNGVGSAWVGSVVTSLSDVRVDSLEPLTPSALSVTDLSWEGSTQLLLVAAEPGAEPRVWKVYSDGWKLDGLSATNPPGQLTTITAADGAPPVVSAGGFIWQYTDDAWTSISTDTSAPVPGIKPVYAF
jgi:hypothetical protein